MTSLLAALAATAATWWAHRRWRSLGGRGVRRLLAWLPALVAAQVALLWLATLGAARPVALPLAALASLGAWWIVSHLVAWGARGRDLVLRIPLLAAAAIALAAGSWVAAIVFASLGVVAFRWKSEFRTARLFQLGLAAIALTVLAWSGPPPSRTPGLEGAAADLAGFTRAVLDTVGVHALIGALALFAAFVRDPSLGIRRVSWRLALSHFLVVIVPLALLTTLWSFTTLLGVGRERAQVATRALEREAERLHVGLEEALATVPPRRMRGESIGGLLGGAPGARLWLRSESKLARLTGPPLADSLVAGWLDSLGPVPPHGLVALGDSIYLGAAAQSRGAGLVALVPLAPVLESIERVSAARVRVSPELSLRSRDDQVELDPDSLAADSVALARVRRAMGPLAGATNVQAGRRLGRNRYVVGPDTFDIGRRGTFEMLTQGLVMTSGLSAQSGTWTRGPLLITASAPPGRILSGMFELSAQNPFSYVPLVMVLFLGGAFFVIALWDVVMVTNMGRSITGAIGALRTAAERLRGGDLSHRIEVRGEDELWDVARAFNLAAEGLSRARDMEKEQDRIENELQVARRIQERLLPAEPPRVPGLEIAGHYDPAREVGGDYFDHLALGDGRVLLVIADVSGKSVPAALIMSGFRAGLVSQDLARIEPRALAERLNDLLHTSLDPGKFVTSFIGFLDGATGRLHYVNAGHNPPVLLRRDGSFELLEKGGTILGILPASAYEEGEAALEPGDLVALYTDGVTEGANAAGEQWGDERLVAALRRATARTCAETARDIADQVRAFEGEVGATDDITLLIARRSG